MELKANVLVEQHRQGRSMDRRKRTRILVHFENQIRGTLAQTQSALEEVHTSLQVLEQLQIRLVEQLDVLIRMMQPPAQSPFSASASPLSRGSDPDMA